LIHHVYQRLIADRTMGSLLIVVFTPSLAFSLRIVEAHEPMRVQIFAAEIPVEDSMKALSVGLPGREKSSVTPR
jgi:hypothetical protein